jgi:endonuclease/exonuclease/phosphatase (EEP) superfamily protein YafD
VPPFRALVAWLFVAPLAAWVLVRAFGLDWGWPVIPLLAFTPLAVAAGLAVAVIALVLRQRAPAMVAALLALVLVAFIAPRALGGPTGAKGGSGPTLRVLTVNLFQRPGAAERLVALARRTHPDVISLQEVTAPVARALRRAGLGDVLRNHIVEPRITGWGSALYANRPLEQVPAVRDGAVAARMRISGAPPLELRTVHPLPPRTPDAVSVWQHYLRALPPATPTGAVRILAGDFNATLDHAELRDVIGRGYEDAGERIGSGLEGTWPSNRDIPPAITIDHVLADARCGIRSYRVLKVQGSDHRALLVDIALPRPG